jgi:hypothetical protein
MWKHPEVLQRILTGGCDLFYEDVDTKDSYERLVNARSI